MDLEFRHIFTGKGLRSREEQDQAMIQNLACFVTQIRKMRPAGRRYVTYDRFESESNTRSGYADNSHTGGR